MHLKMNVGFSCNYLTPVAGALRTPISDTKMAEVDNTYRDQKLNELMVLVHFLKGMCPYLISYKIEISTISVEWQVTEFAMEMELMPRTGFSTFLYLSTQNQLLFLLQPNSTILCGCVHSHLELLQETML